MKIRRRSWEKLEIIYVIEHYSTLGPSLIAERLGRTPNGVTSLANVLRKAGIDIPSRRNRNRNDLIQEIKKEGFGK